MKRLNYYKGTGLLPIKYNQGKSVSNYIVNSVFDCRAGEGRFWLKDLGCFSKQTKAQARGE